MTGMKTKLGLSLSLLLGSFTSGPMVHAAQLVQVKGPSVLIEFSADEDAPSEGARFYGVVDGKKKALIELTKVKGKRAVGRIVKGKVDVDAILEPASSRKSNTAEASDSSMGADSKPSKRAQAKRKRSHRDDSSLFDTMTYGAVLAYGMDSQKVTVSNQSVDMTGSGMGLRVFADYPIQSPWGAIGRIGYEQFSVKGSKNSINVKTDLSYLTLDLLMRFNFLEGSFVPFALAGASVFVPISKSSDVLDLGQITPTTVFPIGLGMHYAVSESLYVTGTFEYTYFMPSSQVTTSVMALRLGAGMAF
jgi:opacity protein-like surface antigen